MKIWQTVFVHIPVLSSLVILSTVYASIEIQGRKHSTAHSFLNNTIIILGGIELSSPNATQTQFASPSVLSLRFDPKDFSLHSTQDEPDLALTPTTGHTSIHVSNSLFTIFGLQPHNKASPPFIPSLSSSQLKAIPNSRYEHTSVLLSNELYVIGGKDTTNNTLLDSSQALWRYSFSNSTWKQFNTTSSMTGHSSMVYDRWIISCFGQQEHGIHAQCSWLDTFTFEFTKITPSLIEEWPTARQYASMISLSKNSTAGEFLLFGGETSNHTILDDLWKLTVASDRSMTWSRIDYTKASQNYQRSGHASTRLENNIILYYGGQNGPNTYTTEPLFFNTQTMDWIQPHNGFKVYQHGVDLNKQPAASSNSLSGGAIGGIIVGIIAVCAIGVGFFVWKRRHRQVHQQSRAMRFSQSATQLHPIPQDQEKQPLDDKTTGETKLSLPDVALTQNRISTISLGEEFKFSPNDYHSQSHHSSIPEESHADRLESLAEELTSRKKRESTGFKRLTLSLFGGSSGEPAVAEKNRSSSLFQLRASRQPATPSTPHHPTRSPLHSRTSLGAKSVASVQWVGFNDTMDYRGNNWRDSSTSSMHLAVKNTRASSYYTNDSSAQSTPRSPRFPNHLRDSVALYHVNESETQSWNTDLHKSSTSAHHA